MTFDKITLKFAMTCYNAIFVKEKLYVPCKALTSSLDTVHWIIWHWFIVIWLLLFIFHIPVKVLFVNFTSVNYVVTRVRNGFILNVLEHNGWLRGRQSAKAVTLKCILLWVDSQNPDKEMNRQDLLNQPMRMQIAGLPCTVIFSLSEQNNHSK